MKLPFWGKSSPPSHMPSTLVLRFIPDLELLEPVPAPTMTSVAPNEFDAAAVLCPLMACKEHGVAQTGSQELSTAARLATGPLADVPPTALCGDEERAAEACEGAVDEVLPESLLELELELELEGLRLRRELENFHWGILGMSMQKVVVPSCSPSRQGESARAAAPAGEEDGLELGSSGGSGGRGRLWTEAGTIGVATTLPLMAKLCIRSSEEVTDSLRKRPYLGLRSMPGEAAWSGGARLCVWRVRGSGRGAFVEKKGGREGGRERGGEGVMEHKGWTGKTPDNPGMGVGGPLSSCSQQRPVLLRSHTHAHTLTHCPALMPRSSVL